MNGIAIDQGDLEHWYWAFAPRRENCHPTRSHSSLGDRLCSQSSELNSIKIERVEILITFPEDSDQLALRRPMKACVTCNQIKWAFKIPFKIPQNATKFPLPV
jgi:hypothetical protein